MGGGPSKIQQQAATSQTNQNNQLSNTFGKQEAFSEAQQNKANPFYTKTLDQGLPYYSQLTDSAGGDTAAGFAPARAQLEQTLKQGGNALPSGFDTGARSDLASQQGKAFDQSLQQGQGAQFQAKQQGAAGLIGQAQISNPTSYSGQALQGNSSVMNAPLASPGIAGSIGGMLGGLGTLLGGQSGILANKIAF